MTFAHVNIITDDWKRLADFYINVLKCKPVGSERNLKGPWLEKATGISGAHLKGIHLALPGYPSPAPTLEIFQYVHNEPGPEALPNRKGYGHIAFKVENVATTLKRIEANGGSALGEVVHTFVPGAGNLEFVYARDIDGNLLEIQNWS